jgi:hypothetical protein
MPRLFTLLIAVAALGCSETTAPGNHPASHTVNKDGHWHMPGLQSPQGTCTTCHGADLRGGTGGQPSCYACHGQKWS